MQCQWVVVLVFVLWPFWKTDLSSSTNWDTWTLMQSKSISAEQRCILNTEQGVLNRAGQDQLFCQGVLNTHYFEVPAWLLLYSPGPTCNMQNNCSWDQIPPSPHSCKDLQHLEVPKAIIPSAKLGLALTDSTFTGVSRGERRHNPPGVTWRGALSVAPWDFTTNQQVWADSRAQDSFSLL